MRRRGPRQRGRKGDGKHDREGEDRSQLHRSASLSRENRGRERRALRFRNVERVFPWNRMPAGAETPSGAASLAAQAVSSCAGPRSPGTVRDVTNGPAQPRPVARGARRGVDRALREKASADGDRGVSRLTGAPLTRERGPRESVRPARARGASGQIRRAEGPLGASRGRFGRRSILTRDTSPAERPKQLNLPSIFVASANGFRSGSTLRAPGFVLVGGPAA